MAAPLQRLGGGPRSPLLRDVLRAAARERGFNLTLPRGLLVSYQSPRLVAMAGLASAAFSASGTVPAGRACAATVAKLPMLTPLLAASMGRPLVVARDVVDDVSLQAVGAEMLVAQQLGEAGAVLAAIMRDRHLPVSDASSRAAGASRPSWQRAGAEKDGHSSEPCKPGTRGRTPTSPDAASPSARLEPSGLCAEAGACAGFALQAIAGWLVLTSSHSRASPSPVRVAWPPLRSPSIWAPL